VGASKPSRNAKPNACLSNKSEKSASERMMSIKQIGNVSENYASESRSKNASVAFA